MSAQPRQFQSARQAISNNPKRTTGVVIGVVVFVIVAGILLSGALTNWWGLAASEDKVERTETPTESEEEEPEPDAKPATVEVWEPAKLIDTVPEKLQPLLQKRDDEIPNV